MFCIADKRDATATLLDWVPESKALDILAAKAQADSVIAVSAWLALDHCFCF